MDEVIYFPASDDGIVLNADGDLVSGTAYATIEQADHYARSENPRLADAWISQNPAVKQAYLNYGSSHADLRFQTRLIGTKKFNQIIRPINPNRNKETEKAIVEINGVQYTLPLGVNYFYQVREWPRIDAVVVVRNTSMSVGTDLSDLIPPPLTYATIEYALRAEATGSPLLGDHPSTHSAAQGNTGIDANTSTTSTGVGGGTKKLKLGSLEIEKFQEGTFERVSNYHYVSGRVSTLEGQLDIYPEADFHMIPLLTVIGEDLTSGSEFFDIDF